MRLRKGRRTNRSEMRTPELNQQLSGKLRPQYLFFVLAPALRSYLFCCAVPLFFQPALWESGVVDTDIYLDFYLGIKLLQSPDTLLEDAFFLSKILMMAFVCFFLLFFFFFLDVSHSPSFSVDCIWIFY